MRPFFLLAGLVLGLTFAASLVAGALWCVQITLRRGLAAGLAAAAGVALPQALWSSLAAAIVFSVARYSWQYDWAFRVTAAAILAGMGLQVLQSGRITSLGYDGPLARPGEIFRYTFQLALAMPMRLPAYLALIVAVSLHLRPHPPGYAVLLGVGLGVGGFAWWSYFVLLAWLFGKRVPEDISLRSLNKLRVAALAVFAGLFLICVAPLIPGF